MELYLICNGLDILPPLNLPANFNPRRPNTKGNDNLAKIFPLILFITAKYVAGLFVKNAVWFCITKSWVEASLALSSIFSPGTFNNFTAIPLPSGFLSERPGKAEPLEYLI